MGKDRAKKIKSEIFTAEEVSKILKMKPSEIKNFSRERVFDYADKGKKKIDSKNFEKLRVAVALKRDLGVNTAGIDVILHMREKLFRLQTDVNSVLVRVRGRLSRKLYADLEKLKKHR